MASSAAQSVGSAYGPTLDEAIGAVAEHLTPKLVPPEQLARVRAVAAMLPPFAVAGFERRLTGDARQVDLAVYAPTTDRGFAVLGGLNPRHDLAPELLELPVWQGLRRLGRALRQPGNPLHTTVDDIWLEFDLPPEARTPLVPALFFSIGPPALTPPRAYLSTVDTVAQTLGLAPLDDVVRDRVLRTALLLPDGAAVFQLGMPLGGLADIRADSPSAGAGLGRIPALRLCISGIAAHDIPSYLRRVGWGHGCNAVDRIIAELGVLADELFLDLDLDIDADVGAGVGVGVGVGVGERIGVEAHFRGAKKPTVDRRWDRLFSWLVDSGFCVEAVRSAITAWPGTTTVDVSGAAEQTGLGTLASLVGRRASMCLLRGLHHVKLSYQPGGGWSAKAYFGFTRQWAGPARTPVPAAPPARTHPPAVMTRWQEQVVETLAAGVDFLASARTSQGWWEDFDIADGRSDAWVTGYVGRALADVAQPGAADLAAGAWRLLEARVADRAGWGYNASVPPDSDSTTWALLLAETLHKTSTRAFRDGMAFLARHVRREAGLATYADDGPIREDMGYPRWVSYAGWTSAHPCVTAAAASLTGFGERFDEYLLARQRTDGSIPAYWWDQREYATGLTVLALSGRHTPGSAAADRLAAARDWVASRLAAHLGQDPELSLTSAFPIACCLRGLATDLCGDRRGTHGRRGIHDRLGTHDRRELAKAAIVRLIRTQRTDGSWAASARLRIPPPDCRDPDAIGSWRAGGRAVGSISVDYQRTFTTATVLAAISVAARVLHDSSADRRDV